MRYEKLAVVLLLAFVVSVPVANGAFAQAPRGFAGGAGPVLLMPSRAPASWAVMTMAAQDPPAAEAALGLDQLNDARFNAARRESRRSGNGPSLPPVGESERPGRQGPRCEIPGYPNPVNVETLGLNWCGSTVSLQRRVIALQAAGAWCAIAEGTSSSPEQVSARHQDITAASDALDALGALGGPSCQCPTGYRS